MSSWFVYIVRCRDNTLYTGVTTDVGRRVGEHNTSLRGAAFTRMRRPVKLVYERRLNSRSEACVEEAQLKKLSKKEKENLITQASSRTR